LLTISEKRTLIFIRKTSIPASKLLIEVDATYLIRCAELTMERHMNSTANSGESPALDVVVRHLENLVLHGELRVGDPLPSESELASELGLSRLTVREGVRTLSARGLVRVSKGRRPVVSQLTAEPLTAFFSAAVALDARGLLALLELRVSIEVTAASLAAAHASRADIASMEQALASMDGAGDDIEAFADADVRFHELIASASGNRLLALLLEGMEIPLKRSRLQSVRGFRSHGTPMTGLVDQHRVVFDAISRGDVKQAAVAMRRHLDHTREDLRTAGRLA
jgi:GntR family transcriptional repressor for pyruvate dehydrogenase complex